MSLRVKGTRDYRPKDIVVRDKIFNEMKEIFSRHGAVGIDTPVFELKETLMGKYGEDSKLIYELKDQGGQILALRYDLTVPFARFVAENDIARIKRYQIGKVYRRDQPNMNRGRYREFYQCDFDIAGDYGSRIPDAECLQMLSEIMTKLGLPDFSVRTSHRALLDGLFEVSGVPEDKIRAISSAVDKLDKESWASVEKEMYDKGLSEESISKIGAFVSIKGKARETLERIKESSDLMANVNVKLGIAELEEIFSMTDIFGCTDSIRLDLSLARGLDYYTGLIYEVVLPGSNVGSVAAGGRYNNLIGMFAERQIPSVGFSVGVDRLMAIISSKGIEDDYPYQVLILHEEGKMSKALQLVKDLWESGVSASLEYAAYKRRHLTKYLKMADEEGIPVVCFVGESLKVRNMKLRDQLTFGPGNLDSEDNDVISAIKKILLV